MPQGYGLSSVVVVNHHGCRPEEISPGLLLVNPAQAASTRVAVQFSWPFSPENSAHLLDHESEVQFC